MITKKAEYAIITLAELASHGQGVKVTSRMISERRNLPANLVVQLLGTLRDAGWISGTRGPSGGIELLRDPGTITLRQIIELIDGPVTITRCLIRGGPCNNQVECKLRNVWSEAQDKMLAVLENVTIRDLSN